LSFFFFKKKNYQNNIVSLTDLADFNRLNRLLFN